MSPADVEIQIALMARLEAQANATAAALQRVLELVLMSVDILGSRVGGRKDG